MKVIGSFKNEDYELCRIAFSGKKFYFSHEDWGDKRWRSIDIGKWIFDNSELIQINNIMRKYYLK